MCAKLNGNDKWFRTNIYRLLLLLSYYGFSVIYEASSPNGLEKTYN